MYSQQDQINELRTEITDLEKNLEQYKNRYENIELSKIIKNRFKTRINSFKLKLKRKKTHYKSKNPSQLSKDIFCAIVNYNCNENAQKLRANFSRYFDTIILDSGSNEKDNSFINLGNVYYSGLLNNAFQYARDLNYNYLLFICSDVICEDTEIDKMIINLKELDLKKTGIYSPSSSGRSHAYCKRQSSSGFRSVPFVEGFFFMANMKVLENICPIDVTINLYGWGLDVAKGYYCRKNNLLCLIDDGVNIYHPGETGYSSELAERDMWQWINTFHDEKFKKFYSKQIDIIRLNQAGLNKVSVIIPCYNQASYMEETIYSLLMQDHGNIEILILNDGSTDNTEEIGLKYSKLYSNIKYIYKENGGLGQTRNEGLKNVSGDFVQFLDSDDLLSTNKIFDQVHSFILNPDVQVSYSEYLCFKDSAPEETWTYSRLILKEDPALDLIQNWETELSIPVHCFLFRASLLKNLFFDEELPNHEDWEFHLKVAAKKSIYKYEPNGIAYYRVRETSMSRDRELMTKGKKMCIQKAIDSNKFSGMHLHALHKRLQES